VGQQVVLLVEAEGGRSSRRALARERRRGDGRGDGAFLGARDEQRCAQEGGRPEERASRHGTSLKGDSKCAGGYLGPQSPSSVPNWEQHKKAGELSLPGFRFGVAKPATR